MAITIDAIHESIHKGAREANGIYERWSNGWWLSDSGVEGLLVCEIARQLYKKQGERESLLLELPFNKIQEWSGARRPPGRPPAALKGQNRADIVLLNGDEEPKFIIEVKRYWNNGPALKDLDRVCSLVRACASGSLNRGFFAVFLAKRVVHGHDMGWKIDRIRESIGEHIGYQAIDYHFRAGRINTKHYEDAVWQSSSLSIEISARR